jgi:adenylate cyclase
MGVEIERKFLIDAARWTPQSPGTLLRQGYLASEKDCAVRVRIAGSEAFLTIKGVTNGVSRLEFEYPIPFADAETLLAQLCAPPLVEKTRHREEVAGKLWEIDVFHGDNAGLIVAEIELNAEDEAFEAPDWLVAEVSDDPRYYNANLALNPFKNWAKR